MSTWRLIVWDKFRHFLFYRTRSPEQNFYKQKSIIGVLLGFIFKVFVLVFFSLVILFPFYFMINTALLTNEQSINGTFYAVPPQANWDSFVSAFNGGYWQALAYTILITAVSVGARVFFSMTAGYAFSLKRWRFKNATWLFMLLTLMLPEVALLLGQYKIIIDLKWNRNGFLIISMFLPFVASTFSAFMFRNAFAAIPDRTKEAAMIDGVGSLKFFWKVAIPMAKATVLTVVILTAFASWNSFTWPQLLLNSNQSGSQRFDVLSTWLFLTGRDNSGIDDNPIIYNNIRMAGAILVIIPMFIAYILFRKVMMRAISRQGSAIKG